MPYTDDDVRQVVERIKMVPDAERTFSQSLDDAARTHRIGTELLAQLLDLGLPSRGSGTRLTFDDLDLANVGVNLGLPCPRRMAMRWWAKALAKTAPGSRSRYSIEIALRCPEPAHPASCRYEVNPALTVATRPGSARYLDPATYAFDVDLACDEHSFDAAFAPLIQEATRIRFHLLPRKREGRLTVGMDLGFLAETGLADCRLATMYLARVGKRLGLPVRPCLGYFVAPPYAQEHAWIDLEVDGRWWAADPFLLHSLAGWGIVDPAQWPPHRSPEGFMWRLGARPFDAVTHDGTPIYIKLAIVGRTTGPAEGGRAAANADTPAEPASGPVAPR